MGDATGTDPLFSHGVLTTRDDGVTLAPEFVSAIADYESEISTLPRDELSELIRAKVGGETDVESMVELGEKDPRTIAELFALADWLDAAPSDWLPLLPVLRLFRPESVPADGVPEPFVPVPAELVPPLAGLYSRLLVYIWLDDCPPCDALKDRLESIFDRPRGMLLLAVYGPADPAVLAREYDVTAGPALLFMRGGRVDSRLYGDHAEAVIANEAERLRA